MDKLILVFYIDIRDFSFFEERDSYINEMSEKIADLNKDENILYYVVPAKAVSRVECLNPKLLSEQEYESVKQQLDEVKFHYDKIININAN